MHNERKKCPYCEEDIALSAKKCRFCGEWLPEEEMQMSEHVYQDSTAAPQNIISPVQPSAPASPLETTVAGDTFAFSPSLLNFIGFFGIGGTVVTLLSLLFSEFGDLSNLIYLSGYISEASFIAVYFMLAYKYNNSENATTRAQGIYGMAGLMAFSYLIDLFSDDEFEFAEVLSFISSLAEIVIAIVLLTKNNTKKIGIWSLITTACSLIFVYWVMPEIFNGLRGAGSVRIIVLLVIYPVVKFFENCKKYLCNQQSEEGVGITDF